MVQGPSLETIDAIRNAPSLESQITALKQLKNDIVGHGQRKELVVKQGVVEPLINILSTGSKATGKRRIAATNGASSHAAQQSWTLEDDARLQATLILGTLASGGRAFVQPMLAAEAPQYLLNALAVETAPRLVTATLQALRNLATSASTEGDVREQSALGIFERTVEPFQAILRQQSTTSVGKQQLKLVADIISLSANDENTRAALTTSGLLDALASLVVSHSIANKHFDYRGPTAQLPPPPPATVLPSILSAITAIISGSNFRAQCFILSPSIRELLSNAWAENGDQRYPFGSRPGGQNPTEHLLPALHVPVYKSVSFNGGSSAFPALASLQPGDRKNEAGFDAAQHTSDPEHASAVVGWFIFLARTMQGMGRLAALRVLALVNNAIEADTLGITSRSEHFQRARERERQLAMLAIPLVVQLAQVASEGKNSESTSAELECQGVTEQTCEVLALLIQDNKELQAAAVGAGAIKRVCPLLKKSFDNVAVSKPMWSGRASAAIDQQDMPQSCRMGSQGLPPEIQHAMRRREGALEALAALAKKEDVHRKAIVEAGVVSCIIDSLKPFPTDFFALHIPNDKITPKDGNTTAVILAACHAAQSISRSVSLLRTSLIDAGIAKPIFDLLKHQDLEVQIAATDVCCNLLLDFSPMREDLMHAGAIKTLTEHARQSEMGLRLTSLWALKHLVLTASRDIKIQCLEELGTGWLVGAIQGEQRETGAVPTTGGVSIGPSGGLSTPNAAGEQVDLLNPASMDVDDPADDGDDLEQDEDEDGEIMYDEASSTHYQASQLRSTLNPSFGGTLPAFNSAKYLSSVREIEQNPALQAKRDDVAVQEQALDFLRNMLNGDDCAVMFEHLLEQIGVEKIFGLLTDKLAPVSSTSSVGRTGNGTGGAGARQVYQPTELIASTVHVLCHIANGSSKHKQLLIAQKQLLHNWLPHFTHGDRRVRCICVWAVSSLTWIDTQDDKPDAQKRGRELKNCGIESAVRALVNDPDLDVRERVRTAVRNIDQL